MTLAEFYAAEPVWLISSVFILSLLVGSFLNVVIHRLPIMMERDWRRQAEEFLAPATAASQSTSTDRYNLMVPRSACPKCGTQITALQNIPVVSWLMLKGRCAHCRTDISARYPIIELSTAILSGIVAWQFGFTWHMAAALLLTWSLIALCMIDFDHQLLPDNLTLPLMWVGLSLSLLHGDVLPITPQDAIVGALAGYLSLWLVFHLFKLATGKEGMGYGDFKLLAALGAWLGWQMLPLIIMLSACVGAAVGISLILLRGRDRNIPIPFGPYLAAAGWIALLRGDQIVKAYLASLQG
jgi:leader peptidase (prepilin peptidase)/N-methyltransferase